MNTDKINRLIEICLSIYFLMLFTRWGEIPTLAAWLGFLTWLFGAPKPYLATLLRDRLVMTWLALLAWSLTCGLFALAPLPSLAAWFSSYDDHLLVIPLLVHLCMIGRAQTVVRILAWTAVVCIALNTLQYLNDLRKAIISAPDNWVRHRKWAYPLVLFSPFLIARIALTQGHSRLAWGVALFAAVLMVLASGSRGAWLALFIVSIICGGWLLKQQRQSMRVASTATLLALPLFLLLPQSEIVTQKLAQGFDTSERVSGTWRPALDMSFQRPLLGHGPGKQAYLDEHRRQLDDHPHWSLREKPQTPHNFYLMVFFGLGLPGLLLTLAVVAMAIANFISGSRKGSDLETGLLPVALLASFVAHFIVRGSFETLSWEHMALFIGLAVGLSLAGREQAKG
jgi:O-antigen ligase